MKEYKWLIVGPGSIANDFAADLRYVRNSRHTITAAVGRTMEHAEAFCKDHDGATAFDDLQKALNSSDFDAAYIATPHPLHYKEAIACLQHKLPVLCEKPAALNFRQLDDIITASKENNSFFMEGMWIRYVPSIISLLDILKNKGLGQINSIRADMNFKPPHDSDNRYFNPDLGGGSLMDVGVYGVFLSCLLMGEPIDIYAHAKLTKKKIDESTAFIFTYNEGRYAMMESSFIKQTPMDAFVFCDNGYIQIKSPWLEKASGLMIHYYKDGKEENIECTWEGRGFQFEVEQMVNALEKGSIETKELSHAFSLEMMRATQKIRDITGIDYPVYGD